jgi:hypothetical protein
MPTCKKWQWQNAPLEYRPAADQTGRKRKTDIRLNDNVGQEISGGKKGGKKGQASLIGIEA